jgi:uncharacterized protein with HEPN domain
MAAKDPRVRRWWWMRSCRNLEIIGEAASKLDAEFRQLHGEVPRRSIPELERAVERMLPPA